MPGRAEREAEAEAEEKEAAKGGGGGTFVQGGEGMFDRGGMFTRAENRQGPQDNPPIIRQEDPARGIPASELAAGRNQPLPLTDRKLVAVWDAQGNPQVAQTINNRQQEHFRPPTPEEWEMLKVGGRFARGGLSGGETAPAVVNPPAEEGFSWKKAVAVLGVVGAIWAYRNWDTVQDWYESIFKPEGEEEVIE